MRNGNAQTAILLATYNGEKYIDELLNSLLGQSNQDFLCYIHDDGSTDGTVNRLQTYREKHPDKFIILDGAGTGGAKENFFYLMNAAKGKHRFYMLCDQDDVWLPTKIQRCRETIREMTEDDEETPCLVYSDMRVTDEHLTVIHESFIRYNDLYRGKITPDRAVMRDCAAGCTMMFNDALLQNAVIKDTDRIIMHDAWLVILAATLGEIRFLDEPLALYRQHEENAVGAKHITRASRILLRIKRVASFSQAKVTREGLYERIAQLGCGIQVTAFREKYPELAEEANRFFGMNKAERCRFVLKYHLYQNRWSRLWTCLCA